MSISASDYTFNSMCRPSMDSSTVSQSDIQSTNFAEHMLDNLFSSVSSNEYLMFATTQPSVMVSGKVHGSGLQSSLVDAESKLVIPRTGDRPLERLHLNQRPFLTVPYLGKGSCDPVFESRLLQGESIVEHRSVSTMSEQTVFGYVIPPDPGSCSDANTIEDIAFNGWARGGVSTREAPIAGKNT